MVERLGVEIGRIGCPSTGMVRETKCAEGVAVEGKLTRNEIDALLLTCLVVILSQLELVFGIKKKREGHT